MTAGDLGSAVFEALLRALTIGGESVPGSEFAADRVIVQIDQSGST